MLQYFIPSIIIILTSVSTVGAKETPVHRHVMVLIKGSEGATVEANNARQLLEQPLESLGLLAKYHDVDSGLPKEAALRNVRAIVSAFDDPAMRNPVQYAHWVADQIAKGRRFVVFGNYGAFADYDTWEFVDSHVTNKALRPLGLLHEPLYSTDPSRLQIKKIDESVMSFEEPLTEEKLGGYYLLRSLSSKSTSYLVVERKDIPQSESHMVIATLNGGYAASEALLYSYAQGKEFKQRWFLNPYRFFKAALALEGVPRMDVASLNGRRLWMSHIDGDGFTTPSDFRWSCGQTIMDFILSATSFPMTVSFYTQELRTKTRALNLAKAIFGLKNVEPASHSDSHPMDWQDPAVDLEKEILGSLEEIDALVPTEKKPTRVFSWSGLANPPKAALEILAARGGYNINGFNGEVGFTNRMDDLYPSRTNLSPTVGSVGGYFQFNERAANDYEFTNALHPKSLGDYRHVLQTYSRTALEPEIPIHVNFHFYAGQTKESMDGLKQVLDWSQKQKISPVWVSEYIDMVRDFKSAKIWKSKTNHYRVQNKGFCRTVVFPNEDKHLDMSQSKGVLGYAHRHESLTVYLDEKKDHKIVVSDQRPTEVHLMSGTGFIEKFKEKGNSFGFDVRGPGPKEFVWFVSSSQPVQVKIASINGEVSPTDRHQVLKPKKGVVVIQFESGGHDRVTVNTIGGLKAVALQTGKPVLFGFLAFTTLWFFVPFRKRHPLKKP